MTNESALRYNQGKPGVHLVPLDTLVDLARVYDYGAIKYAPHNWEKGLPWNKGVAASLIRHLAQWQKGEDNDEESGLPHDLHIAFNALALVAYRLRGVGDDDRHKVAQPPPPPPSSS